MAESHNRTVAVGQDRPLITHAQELVVGSVHPSEVGVSRTQGIAEFIAGQDLNPWVLIFYINIFLLVAGFFLPPVAVILMTSPTLVPIVTSAGFDPIWFGVMLTLNMEVGLITPPVGLNLYVINGIVPDVDLKTVLLGALPFMLCILLGIGLLILFPQIALWLPDLLMGPAF